MDGGNEIKFKRFNLKRKNFRAEDQIQLDNFLCICHLISFSLRDSICFY